MLFLHFQRQKKIFKKNQFLEACGDKKQVIILERGLPVIWVNVMNVLDGKEAEFN